MRGASSWDILDHEAHQAYSRGHNQEAALYWEQAHRLAREQGAHAEAFCCGVWAGVSWQMAAKPLRAQEIFVGQLIQVPPNADPLFVWIARTQAFEVC